MSTVIRYTTTAGVSIAIPLVGNLGAGFAVNQSQFGVYWTFSSSSAFVNVQKVVNASFALIGIAPPFSESNIAAMEELASGAGIVLGARATAVIGGSTGTIESLSTIQPDGRIGADLAAQVGFGGSGWEISVSPGGDGSIENAGVLLHLGPQVGANIGPQVTIAVPLIGENGTLINTEQINIFINRFSNAFELPKEWYSDPLTGWSMPRCFIAGTPILNGCRKSTPIEGIRPGDLVMAFDYSEKGGKGRLYPKKVNRIFENSTSALIEYNGIRMTPGHICLNEDGDFETLSSIIYRDGALVREDGSCVRARTGTALGSAEDQIVHISVSHPIDGMEYKFAVRAGIPCGSEILSSGSNRNVSLLEVISRSCMKIHDDCVFSGMDGSIIDYIEWPGKSIIPLFDDVQQAWVVKDFNGEPHVPAWIHEFTRQIS